MGFRKLYQKCCCPSYCRLLNFYFSHLLGRFLYSFIIRKTLYFSLFISLNQFVLQKGNGGNGVVEAISNFNVLCTVVLCFNKLNTDLTNCLKEPCYQVSV